jgi:hypothetical protein
LNPPTNINSKNIISGRNQIKAYYITLLRREPEPEPYADGMREHCDAMKKGAKKKQLVMLFLNSEEYRLQNAK